LIDNVRKELQRMDSYEQYEKECARIREENEILLDNFEEWLAEKGLGQNTINKHVSMIWKRYGACKDC